MVAITLMGREFTLAPYTLGPLRLAAPHIERASAGLASAPASGALMAVAIDMIAVIAIGVTRIEPFYTAERIGDELQPGDFDLLAAAFHAILEDAGFTAPGSPAPASSTGPSIPLAEQIDDLIISLVAAGVEGGSKRRIEKEWTLADARRLQRYWRENGPPTHIGVAVISAALGNKLTSSKPPEIEDQESQIAALIATLPERAVSPVEIPDFLPPPELPAEVRAAQLEAIRAKLNAVE